MRDDGLVTCHDDINFAAIGIGREHAKSQFMFLRYPKFINYYQALPIVYVAKRRAEAAPGVGKETDYFIVTRDGWSVVDPMMASVLDRHYEVATQVTANQYADAERALADEAKRLLTEVQNGERSRDQAKAEERPKAEHTVLPKEAVD